MNFAPGVSVGLSTAEVAALSDAVEGVDDSLLGEMVDRYQESSSIGETGLFSSQFLPSRYADYYDFKMLRRLYACLVVVAGRLQDGWEPPRCRGEELVLRAILDHAEVCYEGVAGEPTERFVDLGSVLFTDLDHEYLFDPSFDGIDDPGTHEGSQMGVQPLHPSTWFGPLHEAGSVHPMARE